MPHQKINYRLTMKKYIIAFTMSALVLLTGCEDFLDRRPYGQFTADQLTDETVDGLLASAYAGLFAHYFGNNEAFAGPSTNWIFDVRRSLGKLWCFRFFDFLSLGGSTWEHFW